MPDLQDGETAEIKGSAAKPYIIKNTGGVYSCSCPAWRNQSVPIERRTCKHLIKFRGADTEAKRTGCECSCVERNAGRKPNRKRHRCCWPKRGTTPPIPPTGG